MAQTMPVRIGADASCTDGACGQVSRVIVNPAAREVTHLVVDPKHRNDLGRLVPVDLVETTTDQIRLRCTLAEFQALRAAEQTDSVPDLDPTGHAHQEARKQYRLGVGVVWPVRDPGEPKAPPEVTVDSVPFGEVEVHSELTVCATDGEIGQFKGLVVQSGGHQVTHVLLQEGHMWGRKEVAVPIGAVTKLDSAGNLARGGLADGSP